MSSRRRRIRTVVRRTLGAALALALVAGTVLGVEYGRVAAGYAATVGALQHFGSGDDVERIRAERLRLPWGLARVLSLSFDDEGRAEARAFGVIRRRAFWREGLGATRASSRAELAPPALPDLVPPPAADRPWPEGEAPEVAPLPEPARAAVEAVLDRAFAALDDGRGSGTHAVAVVRDARLVAERYRPGYDRWTPILGWSMTKSVTATLLAREIELGRIRSVEEQAPVPAWRSTGDPRGAITLEHLLRMTSGLAFFNDYEVPWSDSLRMLFVEDDAAGYATAKGMANVPGTRWAYADGTSNVLARIVLEHAGETPEARLLFPQRELFGPLGMSTAWIGVDAAGTWVGSSLMCASARDWARFGLLYAQDGVWEGRRLLPEGWADFVASPTLPSPGRCYGAHFWRYDAELLRTEDGRTAPAELAGLLYASGHGKQATWIDRRRGLVIVRLGVDDGRFDPEAFAAELIRALDVR